MDKKWDPQPGPSKNPRAGQSKSADHKNDQHLSSHKPASHQHHISHTLDLQNVSHKPIHHHCTHDPNVATHPTGRPGTAEMLAELSKNVALTHETYRKINMKLDHAIDNVVQHLASKNVIEEQLTAQDWVTIEEAKARVAARKARVAARQARAAARNLPVHQNRVPRSTSLPVVSPTLSSPKPTPWYEDDRFPKPYMMRYLIVINGFTDVADEFAKHRNTFARPDSLIYTNAKQPMINPDTKLPRYTYKVELSGYTDGQIELKFDEKHLMIIAQRPRAPGVNQRETIEIIYLPEEIYADHLKIARNEKGTLLIEERAHYAISSSLYY